MTTLLAIDPGVKALGWATFREGLLFKCGLSRAKSAQDHADNLGHVCPDTVVLEQMTTRGGTAVNAEDLLRVSEVGSFVAGRMSPDKLIMAPVMTWKGAVPKEIHHRRIRAKLTGVETVRLNRDLVGVPAKLQHNVLDAVGLGLFGVGRKA